MKKLLRRYKLFKKLRKLGYITEKESNDFETSVLDKVHEKMQERIIENKKSMDQTMQEVKELLEN